MKTIYMVGDERFTDRKKAEEYEKEAKKPSNKFNGVVYDRWDNKITKVMDLYEKDGKVYSRTNGMPKRVDGSVFKDTSLTKLGKVFEMIELRKNIRKDQDAHERLVEQLNRQDDRLGDQVERLADY